MAHSSRSVHANAFEDARDFDEQLYHALRASPWWMISLAAHVLIFLVSSALATETATKPASAGVIDFGMVPPPEPPEIEPDKAEIEVEAVVVNEFTAPEPVVDPEVEQPTPETENDEPWHETMGSEGTAFAPFESPGTNRDIGIGPGAGSPFGKDRGGMVNGGPRGGKKRPDKAQDAVEDALRWLAAHQSADGGWEAAGFMRWCDRHPVAQGPDGAGKATHDVGVTGLALLAFLGAGYTNRGDHPFAEVVGAGLRWLKSAQDAEGCFGPRSSGHHVYDHATAALAMVEAYGMTGNVTLKHAAQKGLDFIAIARNPYFAWRYGVKPGDNDTSVTGWMMMALKSALLVNRADVRTGRRPSFVIDEDAFDGIRTWIEKMTDPETGRVGYQTRGSGPARPTEMLDRFPAEKSESMTAVGLLARIFLGENPAGSKAVQAGAQACGKVPPRWAPDGSIDMYYWYYATLAMFQVGGKPWEAWNAALGPAVVDTQRKDGDFCGYRGSWDPVDPWGGDGGRVYATAVMAMCLEVHYRYDRVFGTSSESR